MTHIHSPARPVIKRIPFVWLVLAGVLILALVGSLAFGPVRIPPGDVLAILLGRACDHAAWPAIVLDFRLPKALTAMLAGSALAIAGAQMQTLFRNPLADPFILGISSGASLGAAIVMLLAGSGGVKFLADLGYLGDAGVIVASALGALAVFALVAVLAHRVHTVTLLVLGVLVGYIVSAVVRVLMAFSLPEQVQSYLAWTYGSFASVTWQQLTVLAPAIVAGELWAAGSIKSLNGLLLGETYARSLGISPQRARWGIIAGASLLAGAVTAFCGLIGFIGIAVPHLCRGLLRTSDHRQVLPGCALLGATVALLADLLSQLPGASAVLPLNSVTALIGAPVVVWVILKQRNLRAAMAA